MTNTYNFFLLITLFSALIMCGSVTDDRPLMHPKLSLVARLKLDDESPNCWDTLVQLQACSGEIILFFLNGETYLGHGCCHAISTISQQCWPNLIGMLGFTTEEGDILEGYCESPPLMTSDEGNSKGFPVNTLVNP
ncbi:hypothetical protein Ddye_005582 [Dipteronia dyeriana]|uniref:Prolamin-like domain-containing protein n=1 Tax=Dipteronia dyeriana TaxID=168575 RepID=A0AAE0CPW9_9ROSI|nr:hypothetical protein Ddye_005582 [Dipteronia dyeriana]